MKIQLIGQNGKMGQILEELINHDPKLTLDTKPEVIIDFSHPACLAKTLSFNKPTVIGTTGYSKEDYQKINTQSQNRPILMSANFSLGIALLKKMIAYTNKFLKGCDIDIIEAHHKTKKDAPSGTALTLLQTLEGKAKMHSIRAGQIVGEHKVLFSTDTESLTLEHVAHSRTVFAKGALLAAKFIVNKAPGLYSIDDLLESVSCEI